MKKIKSGSGVSEVVGALILVLIVVVAATAFAVFVADRQDAYQRNQTIQDRSDNEKIGISSISLQENLAGTEWFEIGLIITSFHEGTSYIRMISINEHVVEQFDIMKNGVLLETGTDYASWGRLNSTEQVTIIVYPDTYFFGGDKDIALTSYLNIKISTSYGNSFNRNFLPPSPVFVVRTQTEWDAGSGTYISVPVLDGSLSDHPGVGGEILSWDWTISYDNDGDPGTPDLEFTLNGRMVRVTFPMTPMTYTIRLDVADQFGMRSTTSSTYDW